MPGLTGNVTKNRLFFDRAISRLPQRERRRARFRSVCAKSATPKSERCALSASGQRSWLRDGPLARNGAAQLK
jgi:hypothetical protein